MNDTSKITMPELSPIEERISFPPNVEKSGDENETNSKMETDENQTSDNQINKTSSTVPELKDTSNTNLGIVDNIDSIGEMPLLQEDDTIATEMADVGNIAMPHAKEISQIKSSVMAPNLNPQFKKPEDTGISSFSLGVPGLTFSQDNVKTAADGTKMVQIHQSQITPDQLESLQKNPNIKVVFRHIPSGRSFTKPPKHLLPNRKRKKYHYESYNSNSNADIYDFNEGIDYITPNKTQKMNYDGRYARYNPMVGKKKAGRPRSIPDPSTFDTTYRPVSKSNTKPAQVIINELILKLNKGDAKDEVKIRLSQVTAEILANMELDPNYNIAILTPEEEKELDDKLHQEKEAAKEAERKEKEENEITEVEEEKVQEKEEKKEEKEEEKMEVVEEDTTEADEEKSSKEAVELKEKKEKERERLEEARIKREKEEEELRKAVMEKTYSRSGRVRKPSRYSMDIARLTKRKSYGVDSGDDELPVTPPTVIKEPTASTGKKKRGRPRLEPEHVIETQNDKNVKSLEEKNALSSGESSLQLSSPGRKSTRLSDKQTVKSPKDTNNIKKGIKSPEKNSSKVKDDPNLKTTETKELQVSLKKLEKTDIFKMIEIKENKDETEARKESESEKKETSNSESKSEEDTKKDKEDKMKTEESPKKHEPQKYTEKEDSSKTEEPKPDSSTESNETKEESKTEEDAKLSEKEDSMDVDKPKDDSKVEEKPSEKMVSKNIDEPKDDSQEEDSVGKLEKNDLFKTDEPEDSEIIDNKYRLCKLLEQCSVDEIRSVFVPKALEHINIGDFLIYKAGQMHNTNDKVSFPQLYKQIENMHNEMVKEANRYNVMVKRANKVGGDKRMDKVVLMPVYHREAAESLRIQTTSIDAHICGVQRSNTAQMIAANSFLIHMKTEPPKISLKLPEATAPGNPRSRYTARSKSPVAYSRMPQNKPASTSNNPSAFAGIQRTLQNNQLSNSGQTNTSKTSFVATVRSNTNTFKSTTVHLPKMQQSKTTNGFNSTNTFEMPTASLRPTSNINTTKAETIAVDANNSKTSVSANIQSVGGNYTMANQDSKQILVSSNDQPVITATTETAAVAGDQFLVGDGATAVTTEGSGEERKHLVPIGDGQFVELPEGYSLIQTDEGYIIGQPGSTFTQGEDGNLYITNSDGSAADITQVITNENAETTNVADT